MRRSLLIALLAALALPGLAAADKTAPGDGTLSVRAGIGTVELKNFRGVLIGLVGQGTLRIEDPKDLGCDSFNVFGAEREFEKSKFKAREFDFVTVCVFGGKDVRFRLVDPQTSVQIQGRDISLSAVGRGVALLDGKGGGPDGTFSVNAGEYLSLPDEGKRFLLGAQPVPLAAG
jgi:hypothetical protein